MSIPLIKNLLERFKKKKLEALLIIAGLCLTVFLTFSYIREINSKMDFSSNSLIFTAIGDPHYGWGDQYADEIVNAWMNDPNLPAAEFGINIGDFTHFGSPEGYNIAMRGGKKYL